MSVYEKIKQKLDEMKVYPNWEPKEGEELIGKVIRKETITGAKTGMTNDMIVVQTENGEAYTVWKSKTLENLFDVVQVGDAVGLKFVGMVKSEKGRSYKNIQFVREPAM